jgi:hypothetical protein
MTEPTRLIIAYTLVGVVFLIGAPAITIVLRRRGREKLRRRGIKRHGH